MSREFWLMYGGYAAGIITMLPFFYVWKPLGPIIGLVLGFIMMAASGDL
jgi:hypothetical protein